ncbi:MAG: hypothetical protein IJ464_04285 [Alistipes sp.]|nr:hypothetical protein [Alistipes sp.]
MGLIENPKTYTGRDLETIFFRPMFSGANAEELGIRVLYNMPVPTTIQLWSPQPNILQEYSAGWSGGSSADRFQKRIEMNKVKAEVAFSAQSYFQQIYELIVGRADVNLDDLTGTELEQAETEMFRKAIAENLRVLMWMGDKAAAEYANMDGFLTLAYNYAEQSDVPHVDFSDVELSSQTILGIFRDMWNAASPELKALKSEGHLAFYVTSDICNAYEEYLDSCGSDGAYTDLVSGRRELSYHGIKIVDMGISQYMPLHSNGISTHCLLTDSRNLTLAVNTADMPGSEVRMWYNPDEMENRQRATFLVGAEILDENLITIGYFA